MHSAGPPDPTGRRYSTAHVYYTTQPPSIPAGSDGMRILATGRAHAVIAGVVHRCRCD